MKAYFYQNVFTFDYQKLADYYFEQTGEFKISERDKKRIKVANIGIEQTLKCLDQGRKLLEAK